MTREELVSKFEKYVNGTASQEEIEAVDRFLANRAEHWDSDRSQLSQSEKDSIRVEMFESIIKKIDSEDQSTTPIRSQKPIWYVAASIIILLGIGLGLWKGSRTAPLETTYITKSTAKGQKATITLSDGSKVKLNSESSITYPENFGLLSSREVQLTGEAFFDVQRDENKPFQITSGDLLTTVLGTSFNIRSYKEDDAISVSVASGKVKVEKLESAGQDKTTERKILTPGQQGLLDKKSAQITQSDIDLKRYLAWKDGIIYISDATYEQVFEQLSHWYGVEFEFENLPKDDWDYTGEFKDMSLDRVLGMIGFAKRFEHSISDQKVIITFNHY